MFGEVAEDVSQPLLSHFMTHDDVQGVLDFPFQMAAMRFAANSARPTTCATSSSTTTGSPTATRTSTNLPTFLGNHDRGPRRDVPAQREPGATEAELLARDRLAHALMYFSRGNPVIYYGDEQGFTGAGGDQDSRQDMFPSPVPQYNNLSDPITGDDGAGKNDNIGSDETPMDDNFDPGHPLYQEMARLADVTRRHPALRDGAQQHRYSSPRRASTRSRARATREYVVALNNAEQPASAAVPTFMARGEWEQVYGDGAARLRSGSDKRLSVDRGPLSAVVYRAKDRLPRSRQAPGVVARRARPRAVTGSRSAPTSSATRSTR